MPRLDPVYEKTVDPTVNDDSTIDIRVGDDWFNTVTGDLFECLDNSVGAAVWVNRTDRLSGAYNVVAGPIEITSNAILNAPSIGTDQNNYNPNDGSKDFNTGGTVNVSFLIINATSNLNITGLSAPSPAKNMRVTLFNNSATANVKLTNNNAGSVAENRFLSNGNVLLNKKEAIDIVYSTIQLRWIPVTR